MADQTRFRSVQLARLHHFGTDPRGTIVVITLANYAVDMIRGALAYRVMTSLADNVLLTGSQCVPPTVPKPEFTADFVAEGGARQPRLAVPHDLMTGLRIVLAVPLSAEMRDQADRIAELLRRLQEVPVRIVAQEAELLVGEHQLRLAVRDLASEQRHHHDAPGDDGVDRDRPLQPVGGAEQQDLHAAPGFQDPEEVLDAPSLKIEADDVRGLLRSPDLDRGQQEPLHGGLALGRRGLAGVDPVHGDRLGAGAFHPDAVNSYHAVLSQSSEMFDEQ